MLGKYFNEASFNNFWQAIDFRLTPNVSYKLYIEIQSFHNFVNTN